MLDSISRPIEAHQMQQLNKFSELLIDYNKQLNLISRKDVEHLWTRHIMHSLAITKVIDFLPNAKIIDVGTGGGFPGIPLAILFPSTEFYLVDSKEKKITAVKDMVTKLKLNNVITIRNRVENLDEKFDFVVSRAVTSMPNFVKLVSKNIRSHHQHKIQNGILYLKGGDLINELKSFSDYQIFNLSDWFSDDFFITKKLVYLPYKNRFDTEN